MPADDQQAKNHNEYFMAFWDRNAFFALMGYRLTFFLAIFNGHSNIDKIWN